MSDIRQLKKKLVKGLVVENVDLAAHRHPKLVRRSHLEARGGLTIALIGVLILASLPYLAAALTPKVLDERAAWLYSVPGTRAVRSALGAAPSALTPDPSEDSGDGESAGVITVSAADTLEELDLRFEQPAVLDRSIFDLPVRRVILDPGHGGDQLGTSAGPLAEKDITLDIGIKLRDLLLEEGFEVFMTREDDRDVEHDDRVRFANENRGDVFLSIHINWFSEPELRGVETFHLGPTVDPELRRLASKENRGSGYSLTDFRKLLDGVYVDLRRDESRSFARFVHRAVYGTLRQQADGVKNRGVKQAPFVVLIGTEMPAVLAEVSCLSNAEEARLLATEGYRMTIAQSLAEGIRGYAESLRPGDPVTAPSASTDAGP